MDVSTSMAVDVEVKDDTGTGGAFKFLVGMEPKHISPTLIPVEEVKELKSEVVESEELDHISGSNISSLEISEEDYVEEGLEIDLGYKADPENAGEGTADEEKGSNPKKQYKSFNVTLVDANGIEITKVISPCGGAKILRPASHSTQPIVPMNPLNLMKPRFLPQTQIEPSTNTSRKRVSPPCHNIKSDQPIPKRMYPSDLKNGVKVEVGSRATLPAGRQTPIDNLNLLASAALQTCKNEDVKPSFGRTSIKGEMISPLHQGPYIPIQASEYAAARGFEYDPVLVIKSRLMQLRRAQGYFKKMGKLKADAVRPKFFVLPAVDLGQIDVDAKVTRAVELLDVKQRKEYTRTKDPESSKFTDEGTARRVENLRRHRERKQAVLDEKDSLLGYLAAICNAQQEFITELDYLVRDIQ